ncbi:hypothetical protein [Deinococcus xinjiangensis]|uniref:hypothetical protein n=1 Tax=Deinococcus xinjiangensis TaxID=457454 RepID=UPI0033658A1C
MPHILLRRPLKPPTLSSFAPSYSGKRGGQSHSLRDKQPEKLSTPKGNKERSKA